jgi:hypothetical protein
MQGANRVIKPPAHVPLDDCDLPFFDNVISEFARADWTDHQLELAAMLARMMSDMEREQRILRDEGSIMTTEKGTPVVNPRKTVVQMLSGSILSMRRSMQLHARAHSKGHARTADLAEKTANALGIEVMAKSLQDDGLIAYGIN